MKTEITIFDEQLRKLRKVKIRLQRDQTKRNCTSEWADLADQYKKIGAEANAAYCMAQAGRPMMQSDEDNVVSHDQTHARAHAQEHGDAA